MFKWPFWLCRPLSEGLDFLNMLLKTLFIKMWKSRFCKNKRSRHDGSLELTCNKSECLGLLLLSRFYSDGGAPFQYIYKLPGHGYVKRRLKSWLRNFLLSVRGICIKQYEVPTSKCYTTSWRMTIYIYAFSSRHLVLSHFGTCTCSNIGTNLSWTCLDSGPLSFEHPSVLLFYFVYL